MATTHSVTAIALRSPQSRWRNCRSGSLRHHGANLLRILAKAGVEMTMSISERRQGAEIPALVPDQPWEVVSLFRLAPGLAPAILPECVDKHRLYLPGQSDTIGDGKLVYAVYAATGGASRNRKPDRRSVEENASDELLLRNVAESDKAAMHIMYARHRTKVFRFVQRIVRNTAIAEDLVSQVFLDANRYENRARVSTWLLSIARLEALSTLQGRRYEKIVQGDLHGIVDDAGTPDVALDRKKTRVTLRACIEKLSPAHREIIDLMYYRKSTSNE